MTFLAARNSGRTVSQNGRWRAEPASRDHTVGWRWCPGSGAAHLIDINQMSRNADLSRLRATDPKRRRRAPVGFLASFLAFRHTPPEEFDAALVVLTHPAEDSWTPSELSVRFLRRIQAPTSPCSAGGLWPLSGRGTRTEPAGRRDAVAAGRPHSRELSVDLPVCSSGVVV